MTAPAQPPDPRVQRIADAVTIWKYTVATRDADQKFARVLVEELGGREVVKFATAEYDMRIDGWNKVCQALWSAYPNMDAAMQAAPVHDRPALAIHQLAESLNACRAQQRENAETIAALRERVATAEAANTALDNARKSAEQSARDLRENNATLRAELDAINTKTEHDQALMDTQAKLIVDLETELDAIKGEQVPYRWTVVVKDRMSFTFTSLESAQTWANGEGGEVIPLYRHHAPALPVVGACVIGVLTAKTDDATNCISFHMDTSKYIPSKIVPPDGEYDIWLGAPLPTEGGK